MEKRQVAEGDGDCDQHRGKASELSSKFKFKCLLHTDVAVPQINEWGDPLFPPPKTVPY